MHRPSRLDGQPRQSEGNTLVAGKAPVRAKAQSERADKQRSTSQTGSGESHGSWRLFTPPRLELTPPRLEQVHWRKAGQLELQSQRDSRLRGSASTSRSGS